MDMEIYVIDYESGDYNKVLNLRNEVLRKPLGLNLFEEDLSDEKNQHIIIAKKQEKLLACVLIKALERHCVKIRQMAVNEIMQKKGVGSLLMKFVENFCLLNKYYNLELNARKTAIPFYEKLGYEIEGEEFLEIGIVHFKMIKKLV